MTEGIDWLPVGTYKRKTNKLGMSFTGNGKVTFSNGLAEILNGRRVRFGTKRPESKLCFSLARDGEPSLLVSNGQVSDTGLRQIYHQPRYFDFIFDEELALFVEQ